jgi:hypothetical protein
MKPIGFDDVTGEIIDGRYLDALQALNQARTERFVQQRRAVQAEKELEKVKAELEALRNKVRHAESDGFIYEHISLEKRLAEVQAQSVAMRQALESVVEARTWGQAVDAAKLALSTPIGDLVVMTREEAGQLATHVTCPCRSACPHCFGAPCNCDWRPLCERLVAALEQELLFRAPQRGATPPPALDEAREALKEPRRG